MSRQILTKATLLFFVYIAFGGWVARAQEDEKGASSSQQDINATSASETKQSANQTNTWASVDLDDANGLENLLSEARVGVYRLRLFRDDSNDTEVCYVWERSGVGVQLQRVRGGGFGARSPEEAIVYVARLANTFNRLGMHRDWGGAHMREAVMFLILWDEVAWRVGAPLEYPRSFSIAESGIDQEIYVYFYRLALMLDSILEAFIVPLAEGNAQQIDAVWQRYQSYLNGIGEAIALLRDHIYSDWETNRIEGMEEVDDRTRRSLNFVNELITYWQRLYSGGEVCLRHLGRMESIPMVLIGREFLSDFLELFDRSDLDAVSTDDAIERLQEEWLFPEINDWVEDLEPKRKLQASIPDFARVLAQRPMGGCSSEFLSRLRN